MQQGGLRSVQLVRPHLLLPSLLVLPQPLLLSFRLPPPLLLVLVLALPWPTLLLQLSLGLAVLWTGQQGLMLSHEVGRLVPQRLQCSCFP